jgi:cytidylate kinase
MSVIAITRGSLIASQKLTDRLKGELDWQTITREEVIEHGRKYGIDEFLDVARKIMDTKPPNSWDPNAEQIHRYLTIFKAALLDYVVQGNIIYHGIQSHFLLADIPGVLRVKVGAPFEYRVKAMVMERGMSDHDARDYIIEVDGQRVNWARFLHGIDYNEATNYDMVLSMSNLNLDAMVDLIALVIRRPEFRLNAGVMKIIADAHFRARIMAYLIRSPKTRELDLALECDAEGRWIKIVRSGAGSGGSDWRDDIGAALSEIDNISSLEILESD